MHSAPDRWRFGSASTTHEWLESSFRTIGGKPAAPVSSTRMSDGLPTLVNVSRFRFMSRRVAAGSRIRLLITSPNSIQFEKNYNSGGPVAWETATDARTAHLKLHHEAERWSVLELPIAPY